MTGDGRTRRPLRYRGLRNAGLGPSAPRRVEEPHRPDPGAPDVRFRLGRRQALLVLFALPFVLVLLAWLFLELFDGGGCIGENGGGQYSTQLGCERDWFVDHLLTVTVGTCAVVWLAIGSVYALDRYARSGPPRP